MNLLPRLDDSGDENRSPDICACKITQNDGYKAHAADGADGARFLDPVVPCVCEDGDPAFCHEGLYEDEHAKGKGDQREGEVVEYGHGGGEGFLRPGVAVGEEGGEGGWLGLLVVVGIELLGIGVRGGRGVAWLWGFCAENLGGCFG